MLPAEVQLCVLNLLDAAELYSLGLTCRYFWSTVKPEIRKRLAELLGVWAGTPVVCIGEDSSTDEAAYPHGLLHEHDKDELKKGLALWEYEDREPEEGDEHLASEPATLYDLAHHRYRILPPIPYELSAAHDLVEL
jgi:hypothetical protein